jgi:hypothetical protein
MPQNFFGLGPSQEFLSRLFALDIPGCRRSLSVRQDHPITRRPAFLCARASPRNSTASTPRLVFHLSFAPRQFGQIVEWVTPFSSRGIPDPAGELYGAWKTAVYRCAMLRHLRPARSGDRNPAALGCFLCADTTLFGWGFPLPGSRRPTLTAPGAEEPEEHRESDHLCLLRR